jgi:alpha-L-fucosidase 2
MVWGLPLDERVDLDFDTLWSGGPRSPSAEGCREVLSQLRSAVLDRRDYAEADRLAHALQGPFNESYQPLGWLTAHFAGDPPPRHYERSLDLAQGVASVSYAIGEDVYERESFVSFPDRAFIMHASTLGAAKLGLTLDLGSPHPHERSHDDEGFTWLEGRAPDHVVPHYWPAEPAVTYEPGSGLRFAVAAAVRITGGSMRPAPSGVLRVQGADAITVFLAASTGYAGFDVAPIEDPAVLRRRCREVLAPLATKPYKVVRDTHVREHEAVFGRCRLELGEAGAVANSAPTDSRLRAWREGAPDEGIFALLFQYGRYLLMASSRPGSQPANLQGIWNDQVRPPWSCNWTTNVNAEMNYWPAETTNLAECHEPLMELVADLSHTGRSTAQDFYGCRGWAAHHNVDLWRSSWPAGEHEAHPYWVNWQMGGPWLCQHLWEHYAFSQETSFLEGAYPVMREAAVFMLDYLVEGPGGSLVTCPSTSPENAFAAADGHGAAVSAASSIDIWLTKDLFRHCIAASELLGRDQELRDALRRALEKLYEPRISSSGRLQEWWEDFTEPEPGHRHLSHLFCLYPGDEVTPRQAPDLAAAARRSLEHRLANGGGEPGWSRAWVVGLWARLGEGGLAGEHLRELVRTSIGDNLFNVPAPGCFQIDGNLGSTAAIAEMLLQSHAGSIDLLPALPPMWREGRAHGLRARGGVTVDVTWEAGRVTVVNLDALNAGGLRLRCATALLLAPGHPAGTRWSPTGEPGLNVLHAPFPGRYTLVSECPQRSASGPPPPTSPTSPTPPTSSTSA